MVELNHGNRFLYFHDWTGFIPAHCPILEHSTLEVVWWCSDSNSKLSFFWGGVEGSEIFLQKRIIRCKKSWICALNKWKFILRRTLKYKLKGSSFHILHAATAKVPFAGFLSVFIKTKTKKERKKNTLCYNSYIIVFIILFWCLDVKLCILLWILISEWNEGVWYSLGHFCTHVFLPPPDPSTEQ